MSEAPRLTCGCALDRTEQRLGRRAFATRALALGAGALCGCRRAGPIAAAPRDPTPLPLFEAAGTPFELGAAIGRRFAREIRDGFSARGAWWRDLRAFAAAQPRSVLDTFLAAARRHAPAALEELRGWAAGSGLAFDELAVFNLQAEYSTLRDLGAGGNTRACEEVPGCSTIAYRDARGFLLAHNEDGDQAYQGRMFMLRLRPAGRPAVLCASYPGVLPGNAPWVNSAGIAMTTNFIYTRKVCLGVGRYFLDRLAMEARGLDEALRICTHPERAYAFHHVIASGRDGRMLAVEVTPARKSVRAVEGLYVHANHLVHEALGDEPRDAAHVGKSSAARQRALDGWRASRAGAARPDEQALVRSLSSHAGRPLSLCRHPEGELRGSTLLTAVFAGARLSVYRGQPCRALRSEYPAL
jgi:hypothetical protein